jgi:hypothetical protein
MAWALPVALKAPPMITLICLVGAIAGFGACIHIAGEWHGTDRRNRKMASFHEELENYQLALDEEATKREMVLLTFGSASSASSNPVQELADVPRTEPLNQAPSVLPTGSGSGSNPNPEPLNHLNRLYTAQNLTHDEARELITRLALTMSKTQIVEGLWQVKKGGSKAYRAAVADFNLLTQ